MVRDYFSDGTDILLKFPGAICPNCSELISEHRVPRLLQCGHSLCTECCRHRFAMDTKCIICPQCQKLTATKSADALLPNYALLEIISSFHSSMAVKPTARKSSGELYRKKGVAIRNTLVSWASKASDSSISAEDRETFSQYDTTVNIDTPGFRPICIGEPNGRESGSLRRYIASRMVDSAGASFGGHSFQSGGAPANPISDFLGLPGARFSFDSNRTRSGSPGSSTLSIGLPKTPPRLPLRSLSLSDLSSRAVCPECRQVYDATASPRLLHCFHTLCDSCISARTLSSSITCHACEFLTPLGKLGAKGLIVNFALINAKVGRPRSSTAPCITDTETQCGVCLESYTGSTPRLLACGHTFCAKCLRAMVPPRAVYLLCPECRAPTHLGRLGVEVLPVNFALESLIRDWCDQVDDGDQFARSGSVLAMADHQRLPPEWLEEAQWTFFTPHPAPPEISNESFMNRRRIVTLGLVLFLMACVGSVVGMTITSRMREADLRDGGLSLDE